MEFVIATGDAEYEVRAVRTHAGLTVAELVRPHLDGALTIDDHPVEDGDTVLDRLRPGVVVAASLAEQARRGPSPDACPRTSPAFNRPPRAEFPVALPPLSVPSRRDAPTTPRFGWAALVVPIVVGVVLAAIVHPRMALFAAIAPVMALANWAEERGRAVRGRRRASRAFEDELIGFRVALERTRRAEAALRARAAPHVGDLLVWISKHDSRLWERRPHHDDSMRLALGSGCVAWRPAIKSPSPQLAPEAEQLLAKHDSLHGVPILVNLGRGAVVGCAGNPRHRRALARSLIIQAVALHGPADLALTIVTDRPDAWDWAKWLPHVVVDAAAGQRRLAPDSRSAERVLAGFAASRRSSSTSPDFEEPQHATELLLVDVDELALVEYEAVRRAIRRAADGAGSVLVLNSSVDGLSSNCRVVAMIDEDGLVEVRIPDEGFLLEAVRPWQLSASECRAAARRLAGLVDPEVPATSRSLPDQVRLLDLLDLGDPTAAAILDRWNRHAGLDPGVPVGTGDGGPLMISLAEDGPHALLAGTTGSGKSELLRSLVASLAATSSPDELTFVLIDYKGGSAFDVCARLPHTVGLVTDLDGHLAQRALTCLEAELRTREEQLRLAGAVDLAAYRSGSGSMPLPRLFVAVDEFAALAKELPDFVSSLVDIAQRGRSLGMHLLLATQRPQGVVGDHIRANTNLRIALRVQDGADSNDVIGSPAAAGIGRAQPGRGLVRFGAGEVRLFQAARVSEPAEGPMGLQLLPFLFDARQPQPMAQEQDPDTPTDLDALVAAIGGAFALRGGLPPRRPWPEPLGREVDVADLPPPSAARRAVVGLADEPGRQRQCSTEWGPLDGNLLLYGAAGSGTTTALGTLALGLAGSSTPDELHVYVLDFDNQSLAPLAELPHCGTVVGAGDRERQIRLVRMLQHEIDHRRAAASDDADSIPAAPIVVVFLDNYAGFAAQFAEPSDMAMRASLARIVAEGPGVGVASVITAKHPIDVPAHVTAAVPARLLFRLADRYEYAGLGAPGIEPPVVAGRCYESWTGREVHVARWRHGDLGAAVELIDRTPAMEEPPATVGVLPTDVEVTQLLDAARFDDTEWSVPIGIGGADLQPAGFRLGEGDHIVVSGRARAGKSTTLVTLARVVAAAAPTIRVVAVTPRRSPLRTCPEVDVTIDSVAGLPALIEAGASTLILIDDATLVEDDGGLLEALAEHPRAGVHVAAAAPADALRSAYGHWTAAMRRSRVGVALQPNPATDGDLWHTPLPRGGPAHLPAGRGYLVVDGQTQLVQVASR